MPSDVALFGKDPLARIVDVHPVRGGGDEEEALVRIYRRSEDGRHVYEETAPFYPFFFLSDVRLLRGFPRERYRFQELAGENFYRFLIAFGSWGAYWDAVRHVERATETSEKRPAELYLVNNPAQQYLTQTGRTLFKGMGFDDLHRLQLDIETYTESGFPNAEREEDAIIIVSMSDNRGWTRLIEGRALPERTMLEEVVRVIQEKDPDVIEGHNLYAFDVPYLMTRCARHGVAFAIGRDGSVPRSFPSSMRFAERTIDFPALEIAGRHVVDTYFQVMAYDVFKRDLRGYGLKAAARYFGFAPEGRTYVPGDQIGRVWREDPERLLAYALDDVIETERLARHLSGSTFYLTQMLPMPYGQVARTGPASKIESLFVREYLRRRHSVPRSAWGSQAVGGYTDVFVTGTVGPVVYADVESLYPSIMLHNDVRPKGDALHLFPDLLRRLTDLRFDAKEAMRQATSAELRGELDARQTAYKNVINCFDPQTEVVTVDGIKPIADVRVGDRVYAIDPATLDVEIKPVVAAYAQHYEGPMVAIEARHVDYLVTPNHRFLTRKLSGDAPTPYAWEEAGAMLRDDVRRMLPPRRALPAVVTADSPTGPCPSRTAPGEDGALSRALPLVSALPQCHPYGSGDPGETDGEAWIPAFAGMTMEGGEPRATALFRYQQREGRPERAAKPETLSLGPSDSPLYPTIGPSERRQVDYAGPIHCVTVADHHTLLCGRNGLFNWCGQSFYGSLGFSLAAFNDFAEADRVASIGQEILRRIIALIRREGGRVVEVDTDGVLFVPPEAWRGEEAERAFVAKLSEEMPEGIRIGFDGRFQKMLSYKKKNYALLGYDGRLKFKGSSLVSRSSEAFGRRFVREAIERLLEEDVQGLHDLYLQVRDRIIAHDWKGVESFQRTETLKDTAERYLADVAEGRRPRAAAYELAIKQAEVTGQPPRKGDRVAYYVTGTSAGVTAFENARLARDWDPDDPDENTAYYLKRLDEFARKFEPFFAEHDFRLVFSPEDLFGFSAEGIRLQQHEQAPSDVEDEVPF